MYGSTLRNTKGVRLLICFTVLMLASMDICFAGESEAEHEDTEKKNRLGIFVGATHAEGEYLETLGIEYGYYVNENVEFGILVERAVREDDSTLLIAFAALHLDKGFYVGAGIGKKDPGTERRNTLRVSVGYEFEITDDWSLEPQFHLDFIENEENEEVLGLALIRSF